MFLAKPVPPRNKTVTVPSPVGGLNAFDSLAAMPPTDAVVLQNWWPQPYGLSVRKGYAQWATNMPSTVESIAGWYDFAGNGKLFAWSNGNMYDISARAAVGAPIVTALTNSRWETALVTNSAGNFLICVNGQDDGIIYRPTGVFRITAGTGVPPNTWAGIAPSNAAMPCVHQRRLWVVERDSSRGWYLPPDSIQGTFTAFDFGPQFARGGYLQALATWTIDDGNGAEDHLVAISSNGECVVYAGTDPSDSTKWGLVGVYYVGAPIAGRRFVTKAGGDLQILTQRGVVSLTEQLVSTKVQDAEMPLTSRKIQFLIQELAQTYATLNGWELRYYPPANMMVVNVPSLVAGGNSQLAANMITKAWTQFLGVDAACWGVFDDAIYFGDYDGNVQLFWTGNSDGVLIDNTGGVGITTAAQQAYSYLGDRATQKQVGMYRPMFLTGGSIGLQSAIAYNFEDQAVLSPGYVPLPLGSLWGSGRWGSAFWAGGSTVRQSWIQAQGMGVAASLKMVTLTSADVLWVATDYSYVEGRGIL